MDKSDIFAVLTLRSPETVEAFSLPNNGALYYRPPQSSAALPGLTSRDTTPPFDASEPEFRDDYTGKIVLTFGQTLKAIQSGWQFGAGSDWCDVELRHTKFPGISKRHFSIRVVEDLRIFLYANSNNSMAISYDGQFRGGIRKFESWILARRPGQKKIWGEAEICLPYRRGFTFTIEFPNHANPTPRYIENLSAFYRQSQEEGPPMGMLTLASSKTTAVPSTAMSSEGAPRYVHAHPEQRPIGSGGFGEVYLMMDPRGGALYAVKKFKRGLGSLSGTQRSGRDLKEMPQAIIAEISIMMNHQHDHVVEFFGFHQSPEPMIVMKYYPLGSLQKFLKRRDYFNVPRLTSTLRQVLLGLSFLHERTIAHRDLKLDNVLVDAPFHLVIADFGISRAVSADELMMSCVGTPSFQAPETFYGGYDNSADIWSVGVMMLKLHDYFPAEPSYRALGRFQYSDTWTPMIQNEAAQWKGADSNDLSGLVQHMLHMKPHKRPTANEALVYGAFNEMFVLADDTFADTAATQRAMQLEDDAHRLRRRRPRAPSGAADSGRSDADDTTTTTAAAPPARPTESPQTEPEATARPFQRQPLPPPEHAGQHRDEGYMTAPHTKSRAAAAPSAVSTSSRECDLFRDTPRAIRAAEQEGRRESGGRRGKGGRGGASEVSG